MRVIESLFTSLWFWISVSAGLHLLTFTSFSKHQYKDHEFSVEHAPHSMEASLVPWVPPLQEQEVPDEVIPEHVQEELIEIIHSAESEPIEWINQIETEGVMEKLMEEVINEIPDPVEEEETEEKDLIAKAEFPQVPESEAQRNVPIPRILVSPSMQGAETLHPPSPLINPAPIYPRLARRLGHEGVVTLEMTIGEDGLPQGVEVIESSGQRELDARALETVLTKWRFLPALQGEKPQVTDYTVDIHFSLR